MEDQPVTVGNADVLDRLARLRAILPLMATDLAAARRRAATLEAENHRLAARIQELESRVAAPPRRPARRPRRLGAATG